MSLYQKAKEHTNSNLEKNFSLQLDPETYYKNIELDAALGLLFLRYNKVQPNSYMENKINKLSPIKPTKQHLKNNQSSFTVTSLYSNSNKTTKFYHSTPIIKNLNTIGKRKKIFKIEKKEPLMSFCKNILKEFLEKSN